jgi:tetratricopeptide (TPR) repeat protein
VPTPLPDDTTATPFARRPFVGRRRELDLLRGHLGGGLVVVTGDPGIGKTRLAEELAAYAEREGAVVRWGRCWEGDGAPAFWPWIQILRDEARAAGPGSRAALEHALAEVEGRLHEMGSTRDATNPPALDPGPSRFRLFDEVTRLLVAAAHERPRVLVLEDLHWADVPTIRLLQFLARHARGAPLLALVTYRDVEIDKTHPLTGTLGELARHGEPIALGGLDAEDVERYVAATLGDGRARSLAARLHRETEGHPFFLVELVRLFEGGHAAALTGIPDGVRELIARRLRQRSPACRELLAIAAVVGRDFGVPVLRRVADVADRDVLTLVDEALEARLVTAVDADTYRFSHALIREALYADVPLARRLPLHRAIGEAILAGASDRDAHAAELAHHFRAAAADGDVALAVEYGRRAGDRATQALAHEEAVAHYERTLQVLERHGGPNEPGQCPLLIALGLAHVRAGDPAAAEAAFVRAAALARERKLPEELARAALGLGEITREHDGFVPLLEEALATLDGADSVLRARLLGRLSVALYWARPETRKRALSDEGLAMARRLGYAPTLCYALSSRIAALSGPDDVEERLATATEMIAVAEQCDNREFALIGRGWTIADAYALGDVHRARFALAAFAAAANESRHPYFVWWLAALRTMEAILEGRLAEAEPLAQESFALGQRAVPVDATQVYAAHSYVLCIEGERPEQIEPVMRAVVEQFPRVPGGRCVLALLYADGGRHAEASAELDALAADRFGALPRNPEWLSSLAALAATSALLPGAPHAETLYELLLPYRGRVMMTGMGVMCSGAVSHHLGLLATSLGRFADAETYFEEALALHERIGAAAWAAYTRYQWAVLAIARGDAARAAVLADEARRFAETHDMRRLQRLLRAVPVDARAADRPQPSRRPTTRTAVLCKEGDYWRLGWEGSEFRLRDRVGLHHLAALVAAPAQELLAVDLVRAVTSRRSAADTAETDTRELGRPRVLANAEPTPDTRAERAYRSRLADLRDELRDARGRNDLGAIARIDAEVEALTRELARGLGLQGHGRDSRSPIERARISATRAIRAAIRSIQENDRSYGRHLAVTIKTGTFCAYVPDPEIDVRWRL